MEKTRVFFKKTSPVGFIGFMGFIGVFGFFRGFQFKSSWNLLKFIFIHKWEIAIPAALVKKMELRLEQDQG